MWNSQKWIPMLLFQQCEKWHHWWINGPHIFPQSLIGDIYAKLLQHILAASPLQESSIVNVTSDVLSAWCTVHSFQSDSHAISESANSWTWCWAEFATMVNGHDSVRLTCMGTTWCDTRHIRYTSFLHMVKHFQSKWFRKCIQADGGYIELLINK
jgi:hypothetical protein